MSNGAGVPAFFPLGEQAVVATFGDRFEPATHRRLVRLGREIEAAPFPGFLELVPTYTTLCVYYDPMTALEAGFGDPNDPRSIYMSVCAWLRRRIDIADRSDAARAESGDGMRIPVCYCEACGPDLPGLAAIAGMTPETAAALHASARYTVSMIGFLPGFPYLSGLPEALAAPRLDTPRPRVPKGSVAVAGLRTGIYPADSPGGWRLIGRTAAPLFDAGRTPPSLLDIGDAVTFESVPHERLAQAMAERGETP
ncbi:MAG TPA: 5-oxoprolinase subunit PxpB [Paenibacillus sp.]|nr:5-oxoprolinase subunit PxpB [Paenibacillus sp.]